MAPNSLTLLIARSGQGLAATLSLGYDSAFAHACLVQVGLSLAFGARMRVLLRPNRRARRQEATLVLSLEDALD